MSCWFCGHNGTTIYYDYSQDGATCSCDEGFEDYTADEAFDAYYPNNRGLANDLADSFKFYTPVRCKRKGPLVVVDTENNENFDEGCDFLTEAQQEELDNGAEVPSGFVEVTPTQALRFLSFEYAG